jgi:hypothetical protein
MITLSASCVALAEPKTDAIFKSSASSTFLG